MTGERIEGIVQIVIMLAIGAMAGAASFTHVHDVTVAHGQPDWIGWANAVVVELMSIALGLELRRRARTNRPITFVATALVFFVVISLAAQVVEAERSIIGWLAAALPAIGFLVLAKVVLSRTAATTAPETEPFERPTPITPAHINSVPEPAEQPMSADTPTAEHSTVPDEHITPAGSDLLPALPTAGIPMHLLPTARFA
jgi:hypothetical protein